MKQIILLILLSSCMFKEGHYINDNPIEEIGEAALQGYTGANIDFTPYSPERPKVNLIRKDF